MTGLQRWRKVARGLTACAIAWEVAATVAGLIVLALVAARGGAIPADRLVDVVGALGLCGFVLWAGRDAKRRRRRQPPGRAATADDEA